ncbi:lysM domain/BON superfamily protein [bacterium BMS3Abin05]|nr:lysM domain/BON superfamily protein [bacterium BMS3Abin05]GBE26335.1 lysM domain/BON superfamily protein [bacterium BMS3Bbin03]HDK36076.1 LysM peptidoglycan-binding domain-containing protein [Bacteroidota bacterium]HDL78548.1 LysM peptidoglycan-binding domain-containing protein [Bacteroidota bacterium]HDZ10782.1 LysM peptidoglycan-binding domain-containing protein [Bacteroidota bacterium]
MKLKRIFIAALVAVFMVGTLSNFTYAQSKAKMKLDDYKLELAKWQKTEADARVQIAAEQKEIDALKGEIQTTQNEIDKTWGEIYALLGTDKSGVEAYSQSLKDLENQVDGLSALSSEELFQKRNEIEALEKKLEEEKANKISNLSTMQDLLATVEGKLMQVKNKLPKSIYDMYKVVRGDYLWKISKKADIYGDPYQWMKIYTYNREMIKNPNLIYPDWNLKIVRKTGPNEYVVTKGDYLKKIAGTTLGDPTLWTKIYEANKSLIKNKNLIYPYEVFVIPKQ